ncbi:MAG: hypothetical protein HYV26_05890 [Candidatus Hydrogenedentes bacterium]|nr:hypothetical protein [Candidatus Hydrogenedentota bacterium]MBI3118359.1 hypothetical protein [Candidatus Hydrogenedentota bacterium]
MPANRGCFGTGAAIAAVLAAIAFLANLTLGLVEVPDNLPFVGNIDEAFATALLLGALRYLGVDLLPFRAAPKPAQLPEKRTENSAK